MSDFTCKKLNRPARISGLKQKLTEAYTEAPEEEFLNSLKGKSQEELYAFISYALPRLPKGAGSGAFSSFTNYYSSKDASGQQFFTSKDVEGALEELRQADEETLLKVAEYALMHWCDGSDAQKIVHGYEAEGKQMGEAEDDEDAPGDDVEPPADEDGEDDLPDVSDEPAPEDAEGDTPPAEDAAPADDVPADDATPAEDAVADEDDGDEDIDSIITDLDAEDGGDDEGGDEPADEPADAEGGEESAEDAGDAPEDAEGDAGEDDAADEPVDAFDGETVAKFVAKHLNIEDPDEILDVIESAL